MTITYIDKSLALIQTHLHYKSMNNKVTNYSIYISKHTGAYLNRLQDIITSGASYSPALCSQYSIICNQCTDYQ